MHTRHALSALTLGLAIASVGSANAATLTWTNGDTGNSNITDADNWSPIAAPGNSDTLVFDNLAAGNPTWNNSSNSFRPTAQFDSSGWDVDVTARFYASVDLDTTTPVGLVTVTTANTGARIGAQNAANWNISAGNTLHYTGVGRFELAQQPIKNGGGVLVIDMTGAVTGNRGITVNAGTVLINSGGTAVTGGGAPRATNQSWSIGADGTLGGTGLVRSNRPDGIAVDGTIAPGGNGAFGALIESLEIEDDIEMNPGSVLAIDFGAAGVSDVLRLVEGAAPAGTFNLSDLDNTLSITGAAIPIVGSYTIVDGANTGTFETILYNNVDVTSDPTFSITYNADSIVVGVIPEPASLTLLGLGGLLILGGRRRGV